VQALRGGRGPARAGPHRPAGQVYGFLGRNGAGKSTALRVIMGITHASAGQVTLFGQPLLGEDPAVRRRIGYVAQEQSFYGWMTPLRLGRIRGRLLSDLGRREYRRLLALLEVPADRRIATFSAATTPSWPWRWPWLTGPSCWCWTSRQPAWTPWPAASSWSWCGPRPSAPAAPPVLLAPHRRGGAGRRHHRHRRWRAHAVGGARRPSSSARCAASPPSGARGAARGVQILEDRQSQRAAPCGRRADPTTFEALAAAGWEVGSPRWRTSSWRSCASPSPTDAMARHPHAVRQGAAPARGRRWWGSRCCWRWPSRWAGR
jgi:hypothetical protein